MLNFDVVRIFSLFKSTTVISITLRKCRALKHSEVFNVKNVLFTSSEEGEKPNDQFSIPDTDNFDWENIEVSIPKDHRHTVMKTVFKDLTPYADYAVFVREAVSEGEARTSQIHCLKISPAGNICMVLSFLRFCLQNILM